MTVDLDALEALAKAATPGPWESWNVDDETIEVRAGTALEGGGSYRTTDMIVEYDVYSFDLDEPDFVQREADADFIAAADPSTVLALIAEIRSVTETGRRILADATAQAEALRAELRQERERADEAERRWHASVKRANEIVDAKIELAEDLYRAEKTIEKVRSADGTTSSWADFGYQVLAILNEYDKKKGADRG